MPNRIVVDTNVLVSALLRVDSAPLQVLCACLQSQVEPLVGNTLFAEYEDVISRSALFASSPLSVLERQELLEDLLSVCRWISVYYLWRPNLGDEGDNHLIELAVAGGASTIVTGNTSDFARSSLRFPDIAIPTPREFLTDLEH